MAGKVPHVSEPVTWANVPTESPPKIPVHGLGSCNFSIICVLDFRESDNLNTRPLSPHLQVYRPQLTSVLSILHRITGVIIALGAIVIALWIESIAIGEPWYGVLTGFLISMPGKILMVIWTLCTAYHLCNGIRHLAWDIGYGFEIRQVYLTGKLVVLFAIILTVGVWLA